MGDECVTAPREEAVVCQAALDSSRQPYGLVQVLIWDVAEEENQDSDEQGAVGASSEVVTKSDDVEREEDGEEEGAVVNAEALLCAAKVDVQMLDGLLDDEMEGLSDVEDQTV